MGKGSGDGERAAMIVPQNSMTPTEIIEEAVNTAIAALYKVESSIPVRTSKIDGVDLQAPIGVGLARQLGQKPEVISQAFCDTFQSAYCTAAPSGGFVNITINEQLLEEAINLLAADERLGYPLTTIPERIVIDYSAPNVAKAMHVGHLRSSIIGDSLARIYEFSGHTVTRQNHLGDWGTQFGMLIEYSIQTDTRPTTLAETEEMYRAAKARFDTDEAFQTAARERVVLLQSGDAVTRQHWHELVDISLHHMQTMYDELGVTLRASDIAPESQYNDQLEQTVQDLIETGIAVEDNGAIGVFFDDGSPLLIEKSDGGYLYGTTDLAALRYRVNELHAERIVYVVDARQKDHFTQVFETAHRAGWDADTSLQYVPFGTVLGEDRKPFKTRDGGTVSLESLIHTAQAAARKEIVSRHDDWDEEKISSTANKIAVAAIKYADLSSQKGKDYVFDPVSMTATSGDTGPYLQYAAVRSKSIAANTNKQPGLIKISNEYEHQLVLRALEFPSVLAQAQEKSAPHVLAQYLHQLAVNYSSFYTNSPINNLGDQELQASRLGLNQLAGRILTQGCELLGIPELDEM